MALLALFALTSAFAAGENWYLVEGGSWNPGPEDVSLLERKTQAYVTEQARRLGRTDLRPWSEYSFQYRGQSGSGRQYVFVNAFCSSTKVASVHQQFVFVKDGGGCYFQLKYDPKERRFYDLSINGYA